MIVTVVDPRPTVNVTVEGEAPVNVASSSPSPVVIVTASGPQGPAGPAGTSGTGTGGGYMHNQPVPNIVWTIQHNLGYSVNPVVLDTNNQIVFGWTPSWSNPNVLILTFPVALAGTCHVS